MILQGKVVRIKDIDLLSYFYPSYVVRDTVNILDSDKNVIYVGRSRSKLKEWLSSNTNNFISVTGVPDIDLTSTDSLVKFVFSRYGKEPTESILKQCQGFDEGELVYCLKIYWQLGRWPYYISDDGVSLYNLFQSTVGSVKDLLSVYYSLLSKYPFYIVESSFLTFLVRSRTIEDQEVNVGYKRLLKAFNVKSGSKIKKSMMGYLNNKGMNEELRFLNLLLSLR